MKEYEIHSNQELEAIITRMRSRAKPFVVGISGAPHRSNRQNRLQRLWMLEAQEQGDMDAEDYRAYCKLHIGAPILCAESVRYQMHFDREIRGLPYALQIESMKLPNDFPVTRYMDSDQKTRYLDRIYQTLTEYGYSLTLPEEHPLQRPQPLRPRITGGS